MEDYNDKLDPSFDPSFGQIGGTNTGQIPDQYPQDYPDQWPVDSQFDYPFPVTSPHLPSMAFTGLSDLSGAPLAELMYDANDGTALLEEQVTTSVTFSCSQLGCNQSFDRQCDLK